ERGANHVERKAVVARRHGCVRGEHAAAAHGLEVALIELERLASVELPVEQTEGEQRRVAFVQVIELRRAAERAQQRRATHSKQDFLTEAIVAVAAVEIVGELAV